ncbi:MAG: NADH-quinone oxidoreductase subunit M [Acidimicrobiales bacterium]
MSPGITDTSFPFLTVLVLLPAGAALLTALVPRSSGNRQRLVVELIAAVSMLATLALAITIAVRFHTGDGGFQMVSNHSWTGQLGIGWHLGVDGISLFLILMSAVLFPIALAGARVKRDPRSFVVWMLLLEAACLGSFVSLDLVLFFLFFELTLIPVYFIIAGWGFQNRGAAAVKFFLYTFFGSAFLLVGIVTLAVLHDQQTGKLTFDLVSLSSTHLGTTAQVLLFLAFTAAFAVKAPIFPFHTWSPDAYSEAPASGSVILASVMAKLGTYGIIRFDLTLFPRAAVDLAPLLLTLGVIGILYGAIVACVQRDLKRLVAYSSLAHLGFIILGTFALTTQALSGSVLQMVNHGLVTAALFILIGWIYERRRSWQTTELRGIQRPAPLLAAVFTLVMMASLGLPGLNSFVGEFLILSGTFITHRWWAVVATIGVVFSAIYVLWAYQQVFHHRPDEKNAKTRDLNWREGAVMVPLVGLIIFLGVYPKPVLDRINPTVTALVNRIDQQDNTHQPDPGSQTPSAPAATAASTGSSTSGSSGIAQPKNLHVSSLAGVYRLQSFYVSGVSNREGMAAGRIVRDLADQGEVR